MSPRDPCGPSLPPLPGEFSGCRFSNNHATNYLPLRGTLPRDNQPMLALLDDVIARGDERRLKLERLRAL